MDTATCLCLVCVYADFRYGSPDDLAIHRPIYTATAKGVLSVLSVEFKFMARYSVVIRHRKIHVATICTWLVRKNDCVRVVERPTTKLRGIPPCANDSVAALTIMITTRRLSSIRFLVKKVPQFPVTVVCY